MSVLKAAPTDNKSVKYLYGVFNVNFTHIY